MNLFCVNMRHKRRFIIAALEVNKHHSEKTEPTDEKPSVQSLMGKQALESKPSKMAKAVSQDEKPAEAEVIVVD